MLGTLLRRCSRIAVAAALTAASGGMAISAAAPAQAASHRPQCVWEEGHQILANPARIYAYDVLYCPSGQIYDYPISILKLVNGSWTSVASGDGSTYYYCNGSAENEYQVLGVDFGAACG